MPSTTYIPASCPKCLSSRVDWLPSPNPETTKNWFRCKSCDHIWGVAKVLVPVGV